MLNIGLTKRLPKYSKTIQQFSVNDGQFLFDVVDTGQGFIAGECRDDFVLNPKKGINLPGSIYNEDEQLEVYKSFIAQINALDVDALGLSFVQTPDLVNEIKRIRPDLVLIAKVENSED